IYFDRDMQRQLLENFARFLAPDGYLILGHSENITWASDLYRPLGMTIYARSSKGVLSAPLQTGKTALLPGSSQPDRSTAHAPQAPKPTPAPPSTKPSKRTASSPPLATPLTARRGPDPVHTRNRHKRRAIVAGEIFASRDAIEVSTLLGSCVCACLYDPVVKAGGMNHFMLPEGGRDAAASACYGVHAMELLITELQKLGGERSRLLAKVFGGAHVLDGSPLGNRVGDSNADFVNSYLNTEGIPIVAQKVGGKCPLRVAMHTDTGKVFVREVEKGVPRLRRAEQKLAAHVTDQSRHADGPQITFF
ncbi:MAG: CheR family methyltransferase, partial [Pirellulaceae bacterium]